VILALRDGDERTRLAGAALALARERYDWKFVLPGLDDFHRQIVGNA
jgi:hypothetical protein